MAELVLTAAQSAFRTLATASLRGLGQAAIAYAGASVVRALDNSNIEGPRLGDVHLQTSAEGAGVPIIYGGVRLAGQVIWAARYKETAQTRSADGGKGGRPTITDYRYSASFAVGLCEGPIDRIGRVWADGALWPEAASFMRVHLGGEDQAPDSVIEAVEGAGQAPAYRGLAYVVFEDLPLDAYGQRLPNLTFEVFRSVTQPGAPQMEALIQGVDMIPASGEFVYASEIVRTVQAPGVERAVNAAARPDQADFLTSLDQLAEQLPQCGSVLLVVSWFGDDLRAGHCRIRPGVETRLRQTAPWAWSVAGLGRENAHLVTQVDADGAYHAEDGFSRSPVFGGTPDDRSIVQAIEALKARGFKVGLYPFILMDIPPGNGRPDPYGASEQAAFPWRGRITADPAADQTPAAGAEIDAFFEGEWGLNRMIGHYAQLAADAGGVDVFLIGSELRGITTVRDGPAQFPAAARLQALAAQVRAVLGPETAISYAADWSEYFGFQPGDGERFFHLDPVWADPEIDFVAIDWYAPLADWRGGSAHLDAALDETGRGLDYLRSQVEGGEGYDWFYASAQDRDAQLRTPIEDGAHDEPWIWRFKDLRAWWSNPHHERIGGVRQPNPTAWAPQSKPIVFTELGCPAVDKGANQPNVFIDPKSSESFAPYYSTGERDDLIQRRYIEALLSYWAGSNPVSAVYGGPMVDLARAHVWTWDARPFPAFPARGDLWADGDNWRRGHWITGRAGFGDLGAVLEEVAARAGAQLVAGAAEGLVQGYMIDRPMSARAAIEPLLLTHGLELTERGAALAVWPEDAPAAAHLTLQSVASEAGAPRIEFTRARSADRPGEARVRFLDAARGSLLGAAQARRADADAGTVAQLDAPLTLDHSQAERAAERLLARAHAGALTASLDLAPSHLALEPGDVVTLEGEPGRFALRGAGELGARRASLQRLAEIRRGPPVAGSFPQGGGAGEPGARPALLLLDLPARPGDPDPARPYALAVAEPWPGPVRVLAGADPSAMTERAVLTRPAVAGRLSEPLPAGPLWRWDRANALVVELDSGVLSAADLLAVLGGANQAAVETSPGRWEPLQFGGAELIGDRRYRLTDLLRGQAGGEPEMSALAPAGARFVLIDASAGRIAAADYERGLDLVWRAEAPGGLAGEDVTWRWDGLGLRPYAPVHLRLSTDATGLNLSWIRRTRLDGDQWAAEPPLGEEREAYQVSVLSAAGELLRRWETAGAAAHYNASDMAADFPAGAAGRIEVAQLSARFGPGAAASLPFTAPEPA